MMAKLGLLLVETNDGNFSVQLFVDALKGREAFGQLVLSPGQQPYRATYVTLDWEGKVVDARSRDIPGVAREKPDGWLIGSGPLFFPAPSGIEALASDTAGKQPK